MGRARKKVSSWVHLVLVLGILLTVSPSAVLAQGAAVVVQPASPTVAVGGTTTVEVRIEDVTDLYGAEVHMTFSPGVIQVVDADGDDTNGVQVGTGGIFSGMNAFNAVNAVNNSTGTIDYAISLLGEPSGVSGSGTLFSITLEGASEGFSALGFVTVMLASRGGSQISATTVNGAVNVGAQQATETPTTGTPTTTETPMTETPTTGTPTPTSTTPAGQATNTPTPTATVPAGQCTHTVQWGDTLYSIARRYGTTVSVLVSMNGIANPNFIYVGQTLSVPCAATPTPVTQTPAPGCSGSYYTVVSGDTLYSIARRYGTTVDAITAVNYIPNPNFIYVGQRICIPTGQPGPTATPSPGCSAHYTVQAGDTLIAIAARFGTTYWAIAMANNISNPNLIYPGTTLCIP